MTLPFPKPFIPEGPQPLLREIPPGAAYPVEALGPLRHAVEAVRGMTQAPIAIPAQSALAVASLAVVAHADIETLGGPRPVALYALTIAQSGERKSSCDAPLMAALREHERAQAEARRGAATKAHNQAVRLHIEHMERLKGFRVLDPACGSGNFLYLSLLALKDLEHRINLEAEALGLGRGFPTVGPEAVQGIEINPYAAELAHVSVWIGEIQWMRRNGFEASRNPILKPLSTIECRDAVLNADGTRAEWPVADVVVGNTPFLGAKSMKRGLEIEETERLRHAYVDRLPSFTDLVCYWFERARDEIIDGNVKRVGFVATKSIAKNTNLVVMRKTCESLKIFYAWSNEPWVVDGASVRVSIICFGKNGDGAILNGKPVLAINADLTNGLDKTSTQSLRENRFTSFVGIQKSGPFDVSGALARSWLIAPTNPNGYDNSYVLRPTVNGNAIASGAKDVWRIDFPRGPSESAASIWEGPFEYLIILCMMPKAPKWGRLRTSGEG
jgi:hypothetical protein